MIIRIRIAEVIGLTAFFRYVNSVDNDIIGSCGHSGEQAVPRRFDDFRLNPEDRSDVLCHFHIESDKVLILVMERERLPVSFQTDGDLSRFLNPGEMIFPGRRFTAAGKNQCGGQYCCGSCFFHTIGPPLFFLLWMM